MGLSPFRVLGIALVCDQLGKEPAMVFRYPTSLDSGAPNSAVSRRSHVIANGHGSSSSDKHPKQHERIFSTTRTSNSNQPQYQRSEELFFTLSSRQMAKLFRPKHSLCKPLLPFDNE